MHLCMCVHMCIYVSCAFMCGRVLRARVHAYGRTQIVMCVYVCVCVYECLCVHVRCVCVCACIRVGGCTCVRMHFKC